MNVGPLDQRIAIEQKAVAQDAMGGESITWSPLVTVWANVQDELPSRSEAIGNGIAIAANRTRIRYRYRTDVTSAMRVTIRGAVDRVLQIVGGPAEIGRHEFSEILCEAYSTAP